MQSSNISSGICNDCSQATAPRSSRGKYMTPGRWFEKAFVNNRLVTRLRYGGQADYRGASRLVDRSWYLMRYVDVAENGMDPVLHY
jgi:hypothetical protein